MKRLIPFLLTLLLLTGCGAQTNSSHAAAPKEPPAQEKSVSEESAPEAEPVPEAITPESLKAEYEAEGFVVREIVPYEGDFLVYYGSEPCNGFFQWVYTKTGLRAPLLSSGREILDYEIGYKGYIRVLVGGGNVFNGSARAFPVYECAHAALPVTHDGKPFADLYSSGDTQQEPYWAPVETSHTFGWGHGDVALVDVRMGANGLEAVFGPTADNLDGFFAAASSIPVTEPAYDEATHTFTLRFRSTSLSSGTRAEFTSENERFAYEDLTNICQLPTSFPAGKLEGSNIFISQAEVREEGDDTLLILTLTESAQKYNAETGQLLQNESRPYLSLSFCE